MIEAARSAAGQWRIVGFVDPSPCDDTRLSLSLPRLGDDTNLTLQPTAPLILGLGSTGTGELRQKIVAQIAGTPSDGPS